MDEEIVKITEFGIWEDGIRGVNSGWKSQKCNLNIPNVNTEKPLTETLYKELGKLN